MTDPTPTPPKPEATPAAPAGPTLDEVVAEVFGPPDETEAAAPEKAEPAPEPAKEPVADDQKNERVAARIIAAKRAEEKAARERVELKAQKDAQERRTAELDARERRIKLIEDDPIKFFEEFKADPKTFLEKLAGEHAPENVVAKKQAALESELEALKRQIAERDTAQQRQAAQAQATVEWREASTAFIEHVGEHAEKYPHLIADLTEAEATQLAYSELAAVVGETSDGRPVTRAQAYYNEHGFYPDNDVIAEYLDGIAKARAEARTKSAWRQRGEAVIPASKAHGDSKPVPPVRGTSPRTLTSRDASQRTSVPSRRNGSVWTHEDQANADETALRLIEEAMNRAG